MVLTAAIRLEGNSVIKTRLLALELLISIGSSIQTGLMPAQTSVNSLPPGVEKSNLPENVHTAFASQRALREWVLELTAKRGWTITYEEPLWKGNAVGGYLWPNTKSRKRALSYDRFDAGATLSLLAQGPKAVIEKSLSLYSAQGNKGVFRVLQDGPYIEIVPDTTAGFQSLLDTPIAVAIEHRTPIATVVAMAQALQSATGVPMSVDDGAFGLGLNGFNVAYLGAPPAALTSPGVLSLPPLGALLWIFFLLLRQPRFGLLSVNRKTVAIKVVSWV